MTAARHAAARPARPSWWAPLVQWRNWRLLVKLGAVLMVPALLAVALGVVQVQGDVARANSYADMQRLVTLRGQLRTLLQDLQMERTMSVIRLDRSFPLDPAELRQQTRRVDSARTAVMHARDRDLSLGGVAADRYRDAADLLTRLPALRARVASGHVASHTALEDYSTIIRGVLNLDQALFSPFSVPELSRPATTLYDLEAVVEQIHLQHVLLLRAVGHDRSMTPTLTRALQESDVRMRDGLSDFRTVATPTELRDYERTVTGPAVTRRAAAVRAALAAPAGEDARQHTASLPSSVKQWNEDSEHTGMLVDEVADDLTHTLRSTSARLQDQSSDRAGIASVTVFAVLLLALAIGFGIGRHLLRSLTVLRTTALDVAEHRLPAAVESLREGQAADASVDVVPVHTTEEFGQLARAFDTVHSQAVRLAAEQAGLRGDLRNTLVNLSRRSQSLVDRLLLLMEQLERREEDPDQLASLFTLDHLATRMRRNNENMMILCGSALVRTSHQRVALDTVLRGSVSEIERYQRVLVQPSPPVDVIGYAAGDLGRLVAELLDNATAFSPPQTQVVIGGTQEPDGSVLLEIQDEGIGMSESDLAMANRRVTAEAATDTPASRQLGLFVVGRLAGRHGIAVKLSSQPGRKGVRAEVRIAASLVTAQAPAPLDPQPALAGRPTAAGLPLRASSSRANGSAPAPRPPQPFAGPPRRPAAGEGGASGGPAAPPWFAENASPPPAAAPRNGNAAEGPVPPPAAGRPVPLPPFTPRNPGGDPGGDRRPGGASAPEPGGPAARTQAGLPRRTSPTRPAPPPRAERPAGERADVPDATGAPVAPDAPAPGSAAHRAHSFLSSYQAGRRRARPDQTENPSATGRKKP